MYNKELQESLRVNSPALILSEDSSVSSAKIGQAWLTSA